MEINTAVTEALNTIRLERDNQSLLYSEYFDKYDKGVADGLSRAIIIFEAYIKQLTNALPKKIK